jgi:hypothetical protein
VTDFVAVFVADFLYLPKQFTHMDITELEVRTYPFKKSPARAKDGLHQIKIRVFIGTKILGRFRNEKSLEIKLLNEDGSNLMLSSSDFAKIDSNKHLKYSILKTELNIQKAVKTLIQDKIALTSANLSNHINQLKAAEQSAAHQNNVETIWNDEVKRFFNAPIPVPVWEEFNLTIASDTTDNITEEEVDDIAASIEFDYHRGKELKRINEMNFIDRYKNGEFNRSNIFEVFGFCWSENPKNGESLIPYSYKPLIVQLNDYRFNAKPSEFIKDFNDQWIDDFLKYKVNKGYPGDIHIKGYDPFTITKHRNKFLKAKREVYREKSFQSLVKHFKRYIDILQKYNLIPYIKNTDLIEANDYLPRSAKKERITRREHSLTVKEFNTLAEKDFGDNRLNLARDMFILATLGGGFRPNELYSTDFYIEDNRLHIYRSKQETTSLNPIFGQLNDVIARYNGIPDFLKIQDFRSALKEIAEQLNFNRKITSPDTRLDSTSKNVTHSVKELFNAYFARKTCVTVLNSMGLTEEQIIEFTAHADQGTLKYYKGKMTIDDKEKLIESKLTKQNSF